MNTELNTDPLNLDLLTPEDLSIFLRVSSEIESLYITADRRDASIMHKAQNDPGFAYADGKQVRLCMTIR